MRSKRAYLLKLLSNAMTRVEVWLTITFAVRYSAAIQRYGLRLRPERHSVTCYNQRGLGILWDGADGRRRTSCGASGKCDATLDYGNNLRTSGAW